MRFAFSNLYWVSGIKMLFSSIMNGHVNILTSKWFEPQLAIDIIQKYKVTYFFTHSIFLNKLMKLFVKTKQGKKLESLRFLSCGGCFVTTGLKERLKKFFPNVHFFVTYGTSEIGGGVTSNFDAFSPSLTLEN